MDFENHILNSVQIHLRPMSTKPTYSTDLKSKKSVSKKVDELYNKLTLLNDLKTEEIITENEFKEFKERSIIEIQTISSDLFKIKDLFDQDLINDEQYKSLKSEIIE